MENLFKYAKKELSQDAFLLWLLSNACADDKDARETSLAFITFLTQKTNIQIKEVKLYPQWAHIDIVAKISTEKGSFCIFIEDKTTGKEHHQLDPYNAAIERYYKSEEVHKYFYKTDLIESDERARVDAAKWKIIELDQIKSFWENYVSSPNLIISMYAQRIVSIYHALKTKDIPNKNSDNELGMLAWKGFFINTVMPEIKGMCDASIIKASYSYMALMIKPLGWMQREQDKIPYLEIRDRDCYGDNNDKRLRALILTYGMSGKRTRIEGWQEIESINENLLPKSPFHKTKGNATKEVLATEKLPVADSAEFIEELRKCIEAYLKIFQGYMERQ